MRDLATMDDLLAALEDAPPEALVILEAHANGCPKCRRMRPKYEAFAAARPECACVAVNVSEVSGAYKALDVQSVPSFFCFADGERVDDLGDLESLEAYAAEWAESCPEEECDMNESWAD